MAQGRGLKGGGHRSGVTKLRLSRAIDNASADANDTKPGVERPLARGGNIIRQHHSATSFGNIIMRLQQRLRQHLPQLNRGLRCFRSAPTR